MSADTLRSRRFRMEREDGWRQLEDLLSRLERGSLAKLTDAELLAIPKLYRATLSALSVARATSLDQSLTAYLEDLSTRAYFLVYGTRTGLWRRLLAFFTVDWPHAAHALWRQTLLAWLLTGSGAVLAWILTASDPEWFYVFVPGGLAGGRDPTATTAILRETLYSDQMLAHAGIFTTYLFTHNAGIAIMAFALGFAFCLPTALLLVYNGATIGAFAALFASHGLLPPLGGWLLVHGVTELTAVVLAGAAGLRIGAAIAAPGPLTRLAAASAAGRQAATLMGGVFVMLICAGFLEGVVRQAVRDDTQRYIIAVLTGIAWFTYLYVHRQGRP